MIDTVKKYGFIAAGACNRCGMYTEKYRRKNHLLQVRPRRYKFALYDRGTQIVNWTDLSKLENILNEFFPMDKATIEAQAKVPVVQ